MSVAFFSSKKILVTGGYGFLGQYVVRRLKDEGASYIFIPDKSQYDLRDNNAIMRLLSNSRPNIIIHLAAVVGGIGANRENPGRFFYENLIMGVNLMEYARIYNVNKFVTVGTVCSYPKYADVPFKEKDIWKGYPEETNAPYGLAKKMLLVQSQAYRQQYGFNGIYLVPVNLYGPGDNFDPDSSHVIPALIKKVFEAKQNKEKSITIWGTGMASREFLYVDDCAEAIVLATEYYDGANPVNIGTGKEITIRALVEKICTICKYDGQINTDSSKPDGHPRRCLDVSLAQKEFGFKARMEFDFGLRKTIEWYEMTRGKKSTKKGILHGLGLGELLNSGKGQGAVVPIVGP